MEAAAQLLVPSDGFAFRLGSLLRSAYTWRECWDAAEGFWVSGEFGFAVFWWFDVELASGAFVCSFAFDVDLAARQPS